MIDTRAIRMRWEADGSKRDERGQRLFAASEARAAGWGGVAAGTSKWNKVEHRLFCHITQNWRGRPLESRTAVVELIGQPRPRRD